MASGHAAQPTTHRRRRAATSRTASRPRPPNQGRPPPALVFASLHVERRSNGLRSVPIPHLRDDQRAIAGHPARFKVVACGRRWGKTTLGLALAVAHARQGRRVWWVAPTYRLAFQPWRTLKAALHAEWVHKLEAERHIDLPGGGSITVRSADDPDSLRGVGLDFVVVDEAAFTTPETWSAALRPALSDRGGEALIISTPCGHNWFYHAFQRGQDPLVREWQSWRAPTWANPLIPPEDIDEARAVLPRRVFEQEYEAAFLQNGGAVFRGVRDAVCTEPRSPAAARRCVMGVDFGRYHDFTAAVVIDADARPVPAVVAVDRYNEANWAVQRARLAALARRWSVQAILAEANAMGEPNIDALRAEGLPVEAFVTTAQSKPRLIESLASAVESGGIALPDHAQLLAELEAFTYELNPRTNHTQYGAPPGLHDDTVIALALAWHLVCTPRLSLGIAEV
ncbi:MAG: terminase family protein [Aggregatilineales bacterium]|nr:hypothetical protein [Chloroflexota bacterium]